jgi:hypothetical protein
MATTAIEATFVQGDTGPDIVAQLHDELTPTIPLDLTDCTVKFQMRKPDDKLLTVNEAAEITNASQGLVSYSWGAKDLAVYGEYDVQWQVTFEEGMIQTVAHPNRIEIRRR